MPLFQIRPRPAPSNATPQQPQQNPQIPNAQGNPLLAMVQDIKETLIVR
jgi:hypothetical protein